MFSSHIQLDSIQCQVLNMVLVVSN